MSIFREHKSSINFKKVKSIYYSLQHNRREKKPSYMLPKDLITRKNDFSELKDDKSPNMLAFLRKVFAENMKIYEKNKQGKGGNRPRFENTLHEAIVNVKEDTTTEQIFKVYEAIIKTTGYYPVASYMHFDEGYLVDKSTLNNPKPTCLVAGKDYWVDTDGKAYHILDKKSGKYTKEAPLDITKYVAKTNPHCHILLSSFNNGIQKYGKVTRQQLSALQTKVAEILQMERGQKAQITGRKHISHQQFKEIKARENELNDREIQLNKRENRLNTREKEIQQSTHITQDEYNTLAEHSSQLTKFLKASNEIIIRECGKAIRYEMKEQGGFKRDDYADLEKMQTKMYVANNNLVVSPDEIFKSFEEFSSRYKIQPKIETKLKELENELKNENNATISTTQYGR
ncbi:hypothetical protein O6B72_06085 [Campylobacter ureolyticus]|uniref:hypothetical protein n=1 Tax=Campylobacter ureolyticus TaxID=827 RepID=UPI0022B3BAB7|nr:hypothetical protein [Campylobacter ureolyticus]MCZ6156383.1 hypothetical protein [Campylobacter ureolyticus]